MLIILSGCCIKVKLEYSSSFMLSVIILALIQGLTEFLPVSSSGHLILIPKLFNLKNFGLDFDAFLHIGTLFAVLVYFRKDIWNLIKGFLRIDKSYSKLSYGILIATIPVVLIGFGLKDFFETDFIRSIDFVAYMLIAGSVLMYVAEKFSIRTEAKTRELAPDDEMRENAVLLKQNCNSKKDMQELGYLQMLFIGLIQCLALFPGMSRSGSTIAAGIFTGLKKEEAARFSFLLGLPAIAGAGLLAVKDMLEVGSLELGLMELSLGLLISFVSGLLAIDFLLKFLRNQSLTVFVVYRLIFAALLIILSKYGILS
jgi:undecaprenyl-diphosphatase